MEVKGGKQSGEQHRMLYSATLTKAAQSFMDILVGQFYDQQSINYIMLTHTYARKEAEYILMTTRH